MFITTAGRTNQAYIDEANRIAAELQIRYVSRKKRSIKAVQASENNEDCLVVGKNRLELYDVNGDEPFFFHPNLAAVRIKRIENGEHDPYILTAGIERGGSVLDCTLGLGADAIVASYVVGSEGKVTAFEANPYLAYIIKDGMKKWIDGDVTMIKAMRRVEVHAIDYLSGLKKMMNKSVDIVYFDPMFAETISESNGIRALTQFAQYYSLTEEVKNEALRVARKKIVLKDHYRSELFSKLGFQVVKRKTSKFHYGFISL